MEECIKHDPPKRLKVAPGRMNASSRRRASFPFGGMADAGIVGGGYV